MDIIARTAFLLLVLIGCAAVGMFIKSRLPERHQSREAVELVGLVITMLVTFAALVMGLLTYSVKGAFDQGNTDMATLAAEVVRFDQCLRNYGPAATPIRHQLRRYTAAVIATTWPHEPKPAGPAYPVTAPPRHPGEMESLALGRMLNEMGLGIRHLAPGDALHGGLAATCLSDFQRLESARWTIIEEARSTISRPFYLVLVFWLAVIFICFGLNAPRNIFTFLMIALSAVSIASAVLVILDMDTPFSGVLMISSEPMRNALADIDIPFTPPPRLPPAPQ